MPIAVVYDGPGFEGEAAALEQSGWFAELNGARDEVLTKVVSSTKATMVSLPLEFTVVADQVVHFHELSLKVIAARAARCCRARR